MSNFRMAYQVTVKVFRDLFRDVEAQTDANFILLLLILTIVL